MSEERPEYKAEALVQQKLAAMFSANKDEVSIPKIYIDMTGDWKAAAVLDELLFWTLPKNGKTSLRVFKNGGLWLAVRRSDWWERKRLTERQADTAIEKLVSLGLVEKDVFLFDGKPTVHLRMVMSKFIKLYGEKMMEFAAQEGDENLISDIADLYEMMGFLPNEIVKSNLQNGEMLNLQNGEIINNPLQPSNTSNGANAPTPEMPIEWQIAGGVKTLALQDETAARRQDFANLVAMGTPNQEEARKIALAFQEARNITLPESKVKSQRKAIAEMLEMGVKAEHVRLAVSQLLKSGMTVTDLFSVVKTAVNLANGVQVQQPEQRRKFERLER